MRRSDFLRVALASIALTVGMTAQEPASAPPAPAEPRFFRLDFVVKELDGTKVVSSRSYSTMAALGAATSVRAGSRLPYQTAPGGYQFVDVGSHLDFRGLSLVAPDRLSLVVIVDLNAVARPDDSAPPIIRQNSWSSTTLVQIRFGATGIWWLTEEAEAAVV
ncbi:MAG: hypothetical protein ACK5AZ_26605, partial [Bryobacteraceae bacterium]